VRRAVVLLSGGLDSATVLAIARGAGFECHALTADYGQRHRIEIDRATRLAPALGAASHMGRRDIAEFLIERVPEVDWVMPDDLRRLARQAPGILPDPDRMGNALLREEFITQVPDPLRSQLRNLTGVAGDRYAVIPSALGFFATEEEGIARAELHMVVVDVRKGFVEWRTKATGEGDDPGDALWEALLGLVPGMP